MNIHEYQSKAIFRKYNVPTPEGTIVNNPKDALEAAKIFGTFPVVLKAQVHAGGRGRGGGVKIAQNLEEVESFARELIGMTLYTHQTGPVGKRVNRILVEKGLDIDREIYLGIIVDRSAEKILILASAMGGVDIEVIADQRPEAIIKEHVDIVQGLQPAQCEKIAVSLNIIDNRNKFSEILQGLYSLFLKYDCSQVEINPFVVTSDKLFSAIDAKIQFDDNALYRHSDILACRDPEEMDPLEIEALKYDLNYIKLDGNVGNMVNGAGLAMATMDLVKNAGAEPANFLDVGGGASVEKIEHGFRIILSDKNVKAVFVNIFGGILRCDILARGLVTAAMKTGVTVPIVIRMEGTNADVGRKILQASNLKLITAVDLKEAAEKISQLV